MSAAKLAIVTGAASGIGREIALRLADDGFDLALLDLPAATAAAAQTVALVQARGQQAQAYLGDVGVAAEMDAAYAAIARDFPHGPVVLVNNAGTQSWGSLLSLSEADWDRVIHTNLKGCFLNIQRAARLMVARGQGGSIITIGSGCNKHPFMGLVSYTASKGGVEMLTKVAALELGAHGIRVNCVAPGAIELERTRLEAADYAATWAAVTPLGRVGQPQDVAEIVAYLASDGPAFVTGQTLWVDGGVFTRPNWPYGKD